MPVHIQIFKSNVDYLNKAHIHVLTCRTFTTYIVDTENYIVYRDKSGNTDDGAGSKLPAHNKSPQRRRRQKSGLHTARAVFTV